MSLTDGSPRGSQGPYSANEATATAIRGDPRGPRSEPQPRGHQQGPGGHRGFLDFKVLTTGFGEAASAALAHSGGAVAIAVACLVLASAARPGRPRPRGRRASPRVNTPGPDG
jgi:hypothetical protein